MDASTQPVRSKRRYLALEEKRRIVEETLVEGASVARIALAHGLNTNLLFTWRRLHQKGLLGGGGAAQLLPVTVTAESSPAEAAVVRDTACRARSWSEGTIQIRLQRAQVRVEGNVNTRLVRVVLECLRR